MKFLFTVNQYDKDGDCIDTCIFGHFNDSTILRFGKLTERILATAGDNVPSEIEYLDRNGQVVGFWAYGCFHPDYPYQG